MNEVAAKFFKITHDEHEEESACVCLKEYQSVVHEKFVIKEEIETKRQSKRRRAQENKHAEEEGRGGISSNMSTRFRRQVLCAETLREDFDR